jgi:Fe2+ or Zn2+ uptake regulation protein
MKNPYFRYLELANAMEGPFTHLDVTAKELLRVIAVQQAHNKALTVSEAMALGSIASAPTIHRKLTLLLELGLIEQTFKNGSRRTKYLVPSQQSEQYFADLGDLIKQVFVSA